MLGAADIDSWDDDIRTEAVHALRRAGWDRSATGDVPTFRLRRLLDRFRSGEWLSTRELSDLHDALVGA